MRPKIALVTGASSGLGAALAVELANRGWVVHAASRSGGAPARPDAGVEIHALKLDVTAIDQVQQAIASLQTDGGRLDLLINNAGINASGVVEEVPDTLGADIIRTNLFGAVYASRAALAAMRAQRGGTILTIGSLAGLVAPPGEAYYAASKHALEGFMESLQYEVAQFGIRVLLAQPGFIRTALATAAPDVGPIHPAYDRYRAAVRTHWQRSIAAGASAQAMAQQIVTWAEHPGRSMRRRFGGDARWIPIAKRVLPESVFFSITPRIFGI
jgi:NAD(P)-dependent dehydrogenase (short-subunit alcohol dehydrogenase family)